MVDMFLKVTMYLGNVKFGLKTLIGLNDVVFMMFGNNKQPKRLWDFLLILV
jgi:hypothetical protein